MSERRGVGADILLLKLVGAALVFPDGSAARAAEQPSIAGDYTCTALCRPSDAPPAIEIQGTVAKCMSELGGIFTGALLTDRSVSCFGKTGTLSPDGRRIIWSDGVVWERRP